MSWIIFGSRGQLNAFSFLIIWILGFIVLIFSAPILSDVISSVAPTLGGVELFVAKLFIGVITLSMIVLLLRRLGGRR